MMHSYRADMLHWSIRLTRLMIILMLLGLLRSLAAAERDQATISGFIFDDTNGEVLIGANIYLDETGWGNSTNLSGYYVIPEVPAGRYKLICSHIGYQDFSKMISVEPGEAVRLNIRLREELLQTETIIVSADSLPFAERLFRQPVSEIVVSPVEIQRIPQVAEADLLRSLQTLPGVLPLSDYSTALYIRGGTPDQNLILLDGTDVYNPEHAFGLFSTFNTEAIKQVEIHKGGFSAEYGGRLSSVINITNLDGNQEEFEGTASISLLSAKTTLQTPIGNYGAISGSIRRTYFDQTIGKSMEEIPDYYFYDGNLKAHFNVNPNNKLSISTYGGRDVLDLTMNKNSSDQTGIHYDWGNKTISLRWTRVFTPKLFANFWTTGSRFSSDFNINELNMTERNFVSDITVKGDLEYHPSNELGVIFGFEQKNLHVLYRQDWNEGAVNVDYRPEHYIGYVQSIWNPAPSWNVELGLRFNTFVSDTTFLSMAPRFSAKYRLSEKSNLKFAWGIYHQYLHRIPRFFITDIWTVSNIYQDGSRAIHYVLGYQKEIQKEYHVEIEAFHKSYENLHTFNQNFITELVVKERKPNGNPVYTETEGLFHQGDGTSTGIELLLRKNTGIITGWLGYSFARTRYTIPEINRGNAFAPRHDRANTVNIVSTIDVRNAIRFLRHRPVRQDKSRLYLGVNFVYASGQPFTEPGSGYIIGSTPDAPVRYVEWAPTKINNIRFPYYARLDVSLTYEKKLGTWLIAPYAQVFNLGNRKNVWFPYYQYTSGIPDVDEQYMFPLLPTIGINLKF